MVAADAQAIVCLLFSFHGFFSLKRRGAGENSLRRLPSMLKRYSERLGLGPTLQTGTGQGNLVRNLKTKLVLSVTREISLVPALSIS